MIYYVQLPKCGSRKETVLIERKMSHILLKWALRKHLPNFDMEQMPLLLARGEHGKPYLKGNPLHFNLSHSDGLLVCAIADCPVGVDAEKLRTFSEKLENRICTPGEKELVKKEPFRDHALTRLWTLKESYMKYTGLGFAQGILTTEFLSFGYAPEICYHDAFFRTVFLHGGFVTLCSRNQMTMEICSVPLAELQKLEREQEENHGENR